MLGLVLALMASGLNLIYGVFDVLNIAHGEFMFGGAMISWLLWDVFGMNPLLTVPFAAISMFGVGVLMHICLIERVFKESTVVSLILLFGVSIAVQGLAIKFLSINPKSISYYEGSIELGSILIPRSRLAAALVALPSLGLAHIYLRYTKYGVATKATAQNAEIAESCGINVRKVRYLTTGLAAALAGVAGSAIILVLPINPQSGYKFAITAFIVAIVGGLGSFYGSIVAAILMAVGQNILAWKTDQMLSDALIYILLIAVLILRPTGLAGLLKAKAR
jgi:branched-chain amino acid transport system permease protein